MTSGFPRKRENDGGFWLSDFALLSSSAFGWRSSWLTSGFPRKRENDGGFWLSDLAPLSSSAFGWISSWLTSGFPRKRENDGGFWLSDLAPFCHLQPLAGDPVGWFLDSRASARMTIKSYS